ncbi:MAG: DMT family transporter, partial [Alphaproteobacteria bacterium]
LADVNAILNLGPVWATIGAALFLGERLKLRRIMAILVSFAGAMIIIKPGFSDIVPGTWAVMVTAAFFAFSDLIAKQLKARHDDNLIIMALSVTIALVSLPLAIVVWQPISLLNWLGVFVIGLAATLGHMSLMRSFAGPMWAAQAGKYVQLLFVILFGITLFDEIPTLSTLAGAMVVLSAVTYIAMREGRRREDDGMAESSQADEERQGSR